MRPTFDLATLEARLLYCVDGGFGTEFGTYPAAMGPSVLLAGSTTSTGGVGSAAIGGGVPSLSSNPTATAKLFIDFNGAGAQSWGSFSVPATPAYDQDGDASTFSDAEIASINEIWARVAEKYSPFNIDVTTIDPGSYPLGKVMRVVVGGAGAWTGASYGGISYVGSFTSGPNTSWVFTQNLGNGYPSYTAEAVAHESGHAFGLQHQSSYDLSGNKTAEYSTGNGATAPIMGNSYYATRGIWWNGASSLGATSYQDDMARISATSNGFGYRADDHGNSISAADALLVSGDSLSGSGRIEKTADSDFFKFATAGGAVSLSVNVLATGATLDLKLALYSSSGALVATADTASLSESLATTLSPGTYYLSVMSEGNYGDVGQYTISGVVPAPAGFIAAPSNLTGTTGTSQVSLSWTDNSSTESGFHIQRSDDGGLTWIDVATVGANVVNYQDALPAIGASQQYRVYAFDAAATSDFSNVVTFWGPPAPPASVSAKAASATQVAVAWSQVNGASDYLLERSTDGVNWMQVATITSTTYQDGSLSSNATYYYRVAASNVGGMSSFSAPVAATTPVSPVPLAPSNLVATRISKGKIRLTWVDNSSNETGFRIEYAAGTGAWKVLRTLPAGTMTYTAGLHAGTFYSFRVYAYNSYGNSPYCAVAQATAANKVMAAQPINLSPFSDTRVGSSTLTSEVPLLKSKHGKVFKAA